MCDNIDYINTGVIKFWGPLENRDPGSTYVITLIINGIPHDYGEHVVIFSNKTSTRGVDRRQHCHQCE